MRRRQIHPHEVTRTYRLDPLTGSVTRYPVHGSGQGMGAQGEALVQSWTRQRKVEAGYEPA